MTDSIEDTLYALEEGFWTGGGDFYRAHLDGLCLTVFPEMTALLDNEKIAQQVGDTRWSDLSMDRKGYLSLSADFAIICYEASAKRGEDWPDLGAKPQRSVPDGVVHELDAHGVARHD